MQHVIAKDGFYLNSPYEEKDNYTSRDTNRNPEAKKIMRPRKIRYKLFQVMVADRTITTQSKEHASGKR